MRTAPNSQHPTAPRRTWSPRCVLRGLTVERGPSEPSTKGISDGPSAAYSHPRLPGRGRHGPVLPHRRRLHAPQPEVSKPRLSQEALGLGGTDVGALPTELRGVESERSFLRDAQRFFAHLFPGVVGLHPSSLHRRIRRLRRFLEALRRTLLPELVGDPETLIVDSTLLSILHPRQLKQSAAGFEGAAWVKWGSFAVYGVKLHLICATN